MMYINMKITNPESECDAAPKSFSSRSQIIDVNNIDLRRGIILENMVELEEALHVYEKTSTIGKKTNQRHIDAAYNDHGPFFVGTLALLEDKIGTKQFAKRILEKAKPSLETRGSYETEFDYNAVGSNFFRTTININEVSGKYILRIAAAYVGTEPEIQLASALGKPLALVSSDVRCTVSIVDDWWYNVDVMEMLRDLPIPSDQRSNLPRYIANTDCIKPSMVLAHDGQDLLLHISMDSVRYLHRSEGKEAYPLVRGSSIIGGAWTTWAENRIDRIDPKAVQPCLVLSVSHPDVRCLANDYSNQWAVTEDQIKVVQSARNFLSDILRLG